MLHDLLLSLCLKLFQVSDPQNSAQVLINSCEFGVLLDPVAAVSIVSLSNDAFVEKFLLRKAFFHFALSSCVLPINRSYIILILFNVDVFQHFLTKNQLVSKLLLRHLHFTK